MSQKTLYARHTHKRPGYVTNYFDYISNPAVIAQLNDRQGLMPGVSREDNLQYRFKRGFRDLGAWYSPGDILGDAWHSLSYMYNLIFNETTDENTFTQQNVNEMMQATYSQWLAALGKCKTQTCIDQIKDVLSKLWINAGPSGMNMTDTEYLNLQTYEPSLWWNNYKWYVIGGGVGLALIMSLGLTAKILK